jgi:RNA polymerase sigma-70 factor (ECF subfamily)
MEEDVLLVIQGCLKGEARAWNNFVKEFGSVAQNITRKFTNLAPYDRENIVQNVFVKLLRGGLQDFQGTTKYEFLKYFKKIVINEGISYFKTQRRSKEDISLNGEVLEGLSLKELISDQNPHSRPDLTVEEKEVLNLISTILKAFPLADQQIFIMKFKGYKDEEIKEILGVPLGTVASRFSRMKTKVAEELEKTKIL